MEIYLVGGAVRDQLLNLPVEEKDWVVVGSNAEEMIAHGYRKVGKDFPVFLHPDTNEEYALARTERKISGGYTGFDFTATNVSLKEDLKRRDLTINAIAQKADGSFVDPFHGREDLEKRILRHVSHAFIEDPVRVLRIARFAARFAELGFTIAPETLHLMQEMVHSGEINFLVPERVWKELERALQEKNPEVFFNVLQACDALAILLPNLHEAGIKALEKVKDLTTDNEVRFATLFYGLSFQEITVLCERLRVPNNYRELALIVARRYQDYVKARKSKAENLLALFQYTDAFRREERFMKFLQSCEAIALSQQKEIDKSWLVNVFEEAKGIDIKNIISQAQVGKDIGELIHQKRFDAITQFLKKRK